MKRLTLSALPVVLLFTLAAAQEIPESETPSAPASQPAAVAHPAVQNGEEAAARPADSPATQPASGAHSLRVRIINGTTGGPGVADYLELTSLGAGGMDAAGDIRDVSREFTFSGLTPNAFYLLRAERQGAVYSRQFTYEPGTDVTVAVYDASAEDPGVEPVLDTIYYQVEADQVFVSRRYTVMNSTMQSWVNGAGTFALSVPAGASGVRARVNPGTVWIEVDLIETAEPARYLISRPILPGETLVDVGYTFPYSEHRITVDEPLDAPGDSLMLAVVPHDVRVEADGLHAHGVDEDTNAALYVAHEPTPPYLTVSLTGLGTPGVAPRSSAADPHNHERQIVGVAPHSIPTLLKYTLGFFVILAACAAFSLRRGQSAERGVESLSPERLQSLETELIDRIARLDDRHAAGELGDIEHLRQREALTAEARRVTRRLAELGLLRLEDA